jgi:hypothetical protein
METRSEGEEDNQQQESELQKFMRVFDSEISKLEEDENLIRNLVNFRMLK